MTVKVPFSVTDLCSWKKLAGTCSEDPEKEGDALQLAFIFCGTGISGYLKKVTKARGRGFKEFEQVVRKGQESV